MLLRKELLAAEDSRHITMQRVTTFEYSLGVFAGVSVMSHSPSLGVFAGVSVMSHSPSLGVVAGVSVVTAPVKAGRQSK